MARIRVWQLLELCILLGFSSVAWGQVAPHDRTAQEDSTQLEESVDSAPSVRLGQVLLRLGRDSMTLGDTTHVRVRLQAPGRADVRIPILPDTLGFGLERYDAPRLDTLTDTDSLLLMEFSFAVTAYDSGLYYVPGIPFLVQSGGVSDTLFTDPQPLVVYRLEADSARGELLDIIGPLRQGITFLEVLPWLLGLVVVLLLALLAYYLLRRRRRPAPVVDPRRLLPPDEYTLGVLRAQLEAKAWRDPGPKSFFTEITEALRFFLGEVWDVRALEVTTREILDQLRDDGRCATSDQQRLGELLTLGDLVKFAKYEPLEPECLDSVRWAIDFVERVAEAFRSNLAPGEVPGASEESPQEESPRMGTPPEGEASGSTKTED